MTPTQFHSTVPRRSARPDIQGLRMIAVVLVVLSHLFGWPRGGFIGVDVFFVVSGFLITLSLLDTYERTGRISFSNFYRRRIRRIVPAATLVLVVTVVASYFVFAETIVKAVAYDAIAAFFFSANWRFAIGGTDYFTADSFVSPLQHYWSLSVEEQFYFVWPAVVLGIGVVVAARQGARRVRLALSALVMGAIVAGSFSYALMDTADSPTWAYFSTFSRVWELGIGALLAITVSYFERIPNSLRPALAWTGLLAIFAGAFVTTADSEGFPAPWAALPVLGTALVIGAGVDGPLKYLRVLTNRASTYVGDISYSLYLWHWPVIILLGTVLDESSGFYLAALAMMFSLAVLSYALVEDPIRRSNWLASSTKSNAEGQSRTGRPILTAAMAVLRQNRSSASAAVTILAVAAVLVATTPDQSAVPPTATSAETMVQNRSVQGGPMQVELSRQIADATQASTWPELMPSMDDVIKGPQTSMEIAACGRAIAGIREDCTWGSANAAQTVMMVGDSVGMTYGQPMREFAENSRGRFQFRLDAMFGCSFADLPVVNRNSEIGAACPERREQQVNNILEAKPDVLVVANSYTSPEEGSEWTSGIDAFIQRVEGSVGSFIFLSSPPADVNISTCYTRNSVPADCVSRVTNKWLRRAALEEEYAASVGGKFVDSRPWFCTSNGYCPAFVATLATKKDTNHITPEYGEKIAPAFAERLTAVIDS
ncbi:acyltransferase family protein [Rhodococcus fascians]|nr:acyltransferase family protein [Rhodococcus fascians]